MNKLGKIVGKRFLEIPAGPDYNRPHPHTSVGIEIEVERIGGVRLGPDFKRWTTTTEGSLINGVEFVSDPVWGTAIADALDEIDAYFKEALPYVSFRCSVHIHVNVLDMPTDRLLDLLRLGIIYEPAFFRLHDGRRDNIFCVPVASSYKIQQGYATAFRYLRTGRNFDSNVVPSKYAATNINNLTSLGTIEYRHMAGSVDIQRISDWIDVLLQLKTAALLEADIYDPVDVWGEMLDKLTIEDSDISEGNTIINHLNIWR
jgi:hypothetical protein